MGRWNLRYVVTLVALAAAGLVMAGGAGAAAIAVGAALIATNRATVVLVTSVTADGAAQATLLTVA